jgi:hypothetical protein
MQTYIDVILTMGETHVDFGTSTYTAIVDGAPVQDLNPSDLLTRIDDAVNNDQVTAVDST